MELANPKESNVLVKNVLLAFRKDLGLYHAMLTDEYGRNSYGGESKNEQYARFREELSKQIHYLTGVKPSIILDDEKDYVIRYS